MEIKKLAKNTLILASPNVLKFIIGVVRSKLIAVFLGVTGAGIINQLQSTIQQIATFTLSSLPEGMVKLIAQENGIEFNISKISSIIKTYILIIIPVTSTVTILGYVYSNEITLYIFGDLKYKLYFLIGFVALPVSILSTSNVSLLTAFKEIKSIALSNVLVLIINFILFIPLIYFFEILGAVIYVTISFFVSLFIFSFYSYKNVLKKNNIKLGDIFHGIFSKFYFKELISFMSFGLVAGTYYIFTEITTRAIVVQELGITKLGIYAPITAWAGLFVGFILPSLTTYLFPRISESKDNNEIINVINDVIRLMTFVTLPFIIVGITIRELIIPLFYSIDFIEASIYLPYHFAAILFTIWTFAFSQIFAPTGRLKSFLILAIIIHSLSLGLVYFLVPEFGLYGYLAKFTITPIFSTLLYSIYWSIKIKFKLKLGNILIVAYSLLCVFSLLLMQNNGVYLYILATALLIVLLLFLNKQEKVYLLKKIRRK